MYARVSTMEGKPEQLEAGVREYREHVLPEVRKIAGFKGAYLLVDRKSGKNVGITLWDTERNLQDSSAAATKLRTQATKTVAALKPPVVEIYEVAVNP